MANLSPSIVSDPIIKRNFDQLTAVINPLISNLSPGLGNTPVWVVPMLNTGWTNLSTIAAGTVSGATTANAGYNVDPSGRVSLKGVLYNSSGGNLTGGLYMLQAGCRPRELRIFTCAGFDGTNPATYFVNVFPNGSVLVSGTVPSAGYVSVEISFQVEQ